MTRCNALYHGTGYDTKIETNIKPLENSKSRMHQFLTETSVLWLNQCFGKVRFLNQCLGLKVLF